MTAKVQLRISVSATPSDSGSDNGAVIPIEVVRQDRGQARPIRSFAVTVGGEHRLRLERGRYLVRAISPSGAAVTQPLDARSTPREVHLNLEQSAREWLSWATLAGRSPPRHQYISRLRRARPAYVWHRLSASPALATRQMNQTIAWPPSNVMSDQRSWLYSFAIDGTQCVVQVGGNELAWRCVTLPPGRVEVLIQLHANSVSFDDALSLSVASVDRAAESIVAYLMAGGWTMARRVSDEIVAHDESVTSMARKNPLRGAAVAYALIGERSLANWIESFAASTELPDARILSATHLLHHTPDRVGDIASQLLEACDRGLPIFTLGLRLLRDGLRRCAGTKSGLEPSVRTRVRSALRVVERYVDAADLRSPYCSFLGFDATLPSQQVVMGVPYDTRNLLWLAGAPPRQTYLFDGFPPITDVNQVVRTNVEVRPFRDRWKVSTPDDAEERLSFAGAITTGRAQAVRQKPSRLLVYKDRGKPGHIKAFG